MWETQGHKPTIWGWFIAWCFWDVLEMLYHWLYQIIVLRIMPSPTLDPFVHCLFYIVETQSLLYRAKRLFFAGIAQESTIKPSDGG